VTTKDWIESKIKQKLHAKVSQGTKIKANLLPVRHSSQMSLKNTLPIGNFFTVEDFRKNNV